VTKCSERVRNQVLLSVVLDYQNLFQVSLAVVNAEPPVLISLQLFVISLVTFCMYEPCIHFSVAAPLPSMWSGLLCTVLFQDIYTSQVWY
jgi:hypothetical protein